MDATTVAATIIASVLGSSLFTALVTGFFSKRKNKAEADSIIGEAYGALIKTLRSEIDTIRNEFMFMKQEHDSCRLENKNLQLRIEKLERK